MFQKYIIIGILIVGNLVTVRLLINKAEEQAKTQVELNIANSSITSMQDRLKELAIAQKILLDKNSEVVTKEARATRKLNELRDRETTVLAKKSLVALKINKAYQKRQRKLACTTGDFELCE